MTRPWRCSFSNLPRCQRRRSSVDAVVGWIVIGGVGYLILRAVRKWRRESKNGPSLRRRRLRLRRRLPLLLTLIWAGCISISVAMPRPVWAQVEETTTTSSTPPPTTTTTLGVPRSGDLCLDSLSCQQVTAQDLSRLRAEVLTAVVPVGHADRGVGDDRPGQLT